MTTVYKKIEIICKKSKLASYELSNISNFERNKALILISESIIKNTKKILDANKKDINKAKKNNLPLNLIDRLFLNEDRVNSLSADIKNIAKLEDPLGKKLSENFRPNGLKISKVSVPLGVIAVVFESRPNVASDVASLCLKSGNSVILKGGKEAKNSTDIIIKVFQNEWLFGALKQRLEAQKSTNIEIWSMNSVPRLKPSNP